MAGGGWKRRGKTVEHLELALITVHEVRGRKHREVLGGGLEGKVDCARDLPHRRFALHFEIRKDREASSVCKRLDGSFQSVQIGHIPYFTLFAYSYELENEEMTMLSGHGEGLGVYKVYANPLLELYDYGLAHLRLGFRNGKRFLNHFIFPRIKPFVVNEKKHEE